MLTVQCWLKDATTQTTIVNLTILLKWFKSGGNVKISCMHSFMVGVGKKKEKTEAGFSFSSGHNESCGVCMGQRWARVLLRVLVLGFWVVLV